MRKNKLPEKYKNAVLDEDGKVKSFTISLEGKNFRCRCGANCFHKPDKKNLQIYRCNGCGLTYTSE